MIVRLAAAACVFSLAAPALAQGTGSQQQQQTTPDDQNANPPTYEEQVVVTASKTEERLVNAPEGCSRCERHAGIGP
jgi:outer membrane receptor protein involved in Fe transport